MDEIALQGLASVAMAADAHSQSQALQYIEQLKQSTDGWKFCAQAYTCESYQGSDHIKFFCLQVFEHYVKTRYAEGNPEELTAVKIFIMHYLEQESTTCQSKPFIRNKLAQLISLVFIQDYPQRWPSFFADLLNIISQGSMAVDLYLRVLLAIDAEVVDRDIAHTPEESQRNVLIKDSMREQCVSQLADSWYHILTTFESTNKDIVNLCLETVGHYVSWMDIAFFANERMVALLLRFLATEELQVAACDCVHGIVAKGMEPVAKTALIESFMNVLVSASIFKCDKADIEFVAKLSKLINGMGVGLISSWHRLIKEANVKNVETTTAALEAKVPYLLQFLGNEDDDVSAAVIDFASEYIALLKSLSALQESHRKHIEGLLFTVITKLKFDESYNFEKEGEEEAEFQEYRKQMRVLFHNIASLDSHMILVRVHELVSQTLSVWKTLDFKDIEVVISLLYSIGEAIPASHGQHFSGNAQKASALQNMMRLLITSQVSQHAHAAVTLQFFETVVRYDKFFSVETQYIPEVLGAFLDKRGLQSPSLSLRSRAAYLFLRFIKSTKNHLTPYLEEVLKQMQDLLSVNSPDNGLSHSLSDTDQMFVYEAASTVIVASAIEPQKKQELMKHLLTPIATKFNLMLNQLRQETNEKRQEALAECIQNAMSLASRASKGFSGQQTMKQCGCVSAFTELLSVFLAALEATNQRASLQQGVRQYLHRMVVCLEAEILPFLPEAMERLLKQPDARELYDFLPLINQIIMKFKAAIVPFLSQVFMPLVLTVHQVLNVPVDLNDQVQAEEKRLLQRGYFLFLATTIFNCIDVLKNQEMESIKQVLLSITFGAVELPDPHSQKSCFSILRKLVEMWGKDELQGFSEFIYKEIVPACFLAPLKPTFDLNDGQTVLVLGDCAICMQEIHQRRGQELLMYLRTDFCPSKGISQEDTEVYISNLQSDIKVFKPWLKNFFVRAKS